IREQNRLRKQKQREKLRLDMSRDSHGTVTQSHATDIEEDKEIDKEKNKKPSCQKFSTSDLENAKLLFELMLQNNPSAKEPNLEKWANDFRLMRERDNRTGEAIKYLINWTQKDDFWSANILSPAKLRKQFDALVVKIKKEKAKTQPKVVKGKKEVREEDFDLD
ncbi:phage replisome organizer N-terminal domain-containing protein, partial [Bacillus cereus group sp. BceL100]